MEILPKLGAAGGAIATVTAQFIVMSIMILGIVKQKKENVLKVLPCSQKFRQNI